MALVVPRFQRNPTSDAIAQAGQSVAAGIVAAVEQRKLDKRRQQMLELLQDLGITSQQAAAVPEPPPLLRDPNLPPIQEAPEVTQTEIDPDTARLMMTMLDPDPDPGTVGGIVADIITKRRSQERVRGTAEILAERTGAPVDTLLQSENLGQAIQLANALDEQIIVRTPPGIGPEGQTTTNFVAINPRTQEVSLMEQLPRPDRGQFQAIYNSEGNLVAEWMIGPLQSLERHRLIGAQEREDRAVIQREAVVDLARVLEKNLSTLPTDAPAGISASGIQQLESGMEQVRTIARRMGVKPEVNAAVFDEVLRQPEMQDIAKNAARRKALVLPLITVLGEIMFPERARGRARGLTVSQMRLILEQLSPIISGGSPQVVRASAVELFNELFANVNRRLNAAGLDPIPPEEFNRFNRMMRGLEPRGTTGGGVSIDLQGRSFEVEEFERELKRRTQ